MNLIFATCHPRPDVKSGRTKDEHFAADLAKVVNKKAPKEYQDPAVFFSHTYPTRGLKSLLKAVCQRISGSGGEVASIIRVHTQYGGGKTHGLIALTHAVRGMQGVENVADFIDPALLPRAPVRVAALDGENSDPANGLTLEGELRAYSIWGELAYRLAGRAGYERVAESDKRHIAPGSDTISELFGGQPALIMLDEVSVYLRKVEQAHPGASDQFTAFVHALLKAVSSSPNVALVYTLAVGKDAAASDAYKREHERAIAAMSEAESVMARQATQINPTEEDETADVLRRRLFERVDADAADRAIAAYVDLWSRNRNNLPPDAVLPETRDQFRRSYPLHPELLEMLTEKTSALSTFHRTRGMLRLLARTVHHMWAKQGKLPDAYAIHTHHLNPEFGPIREEIQVKLGQGDYTPALKSDVAAAPGDEPSLAEQLDRQSGNTVPVTSYVARTIFWHTLTFAESAKGLSPEHLRFAVCSPQVEPAFVEQARLKFVQESLYLDDKPGAPMRFMVEPNLRQIIRRQMQEVDSGNLRAYLEGRIRGLFEWRGGPFQVQAFPGGPYDVPDDTSQSEPYLVIFHYEALAVAPHPDRLPPDIETIFQYAGQLSEPRKLRNNLVFLAADERLRPAMVDAARRYLALEAIKNGERMNQLADYQQRKIREEHRTAQTDLALAILRCYRHLFYPSSAPLPGASLPLAHTVIELPSSSDAPGNGQQYIERVLHEQKKLMISRDQPDSPGYLRDQTPLRTKGELTTQALRDEYRRSPKLAILQHDTPFLQCIRDGIQQGVFIYREGNQVWGPGDPAPSIQISDNAFVHTMDDAKSKNLWPRPKPLAVTIEAVPERVRPGGVADITVEVSGGVPPYRYVSAEPGLSLPESHENVLRARVAPTASKTYEVEVLDSRNDRQKARVSIVVEEGGDSAAEDEGVVAPPAAPQAELTAEGPLMQALTELWEKARKAKYAKLARLVICFIGPREAWRVHQAVATLRDIGAHCKFKAQIDGEGVDYFCVKFSGRLDKANAVKSLLEPQLRAADEVDFDAEYELKFPNGLSMEGQEPERLAKDLTRYGGGEAYVTAYAAE